LIFEPVSGRGELYSYIVVRYPAFPAHDLPYVVGLVELEEQEGLRLPARLAVAPGQAKIGMRLIVEAEVPAGATYPVPVLRPPVGTDP
jgi:hypothetical protein